MVKQWGGRFTVPTDALMERLGESVSFDSRLAPWDIRASIAHAEMLGACGILQAGDVRAIVRGLRAIARDVAEGVFTWDPALEDVHTNIEVALVARIGDAGKRLHTGRSRNDQIATDVRLWLRDQIDAVVAQLAALQTALLDHAEAHFDVVLPGYTHLQPAQPVLLAHHWHAYVEMLARDTQRFQQLRQRVNGCPLGSAALAGPPHPIDRKRVAEALGFDGISMNSMDAVADRDHLIEFASAAALVMMHLSRLSEELILWSSPAFGFIRIGDAFTTGSSIMPQKKNPDACELVRGKSGRVYGALHALLTMAKGLPLTYNRDLQEDKEPLFDVADTLLLALEVYARMVPTIAVQRPAIAAALAQGHLEATDLADYLVARGRPFRAAHEVVGQLVLYAEEHGHTLPELPLDVYQDHAAEIGPDVYDALRPGAMVRRRDQPGGTAPKRVRAALRQARRRVQRIGG